MADQGQTRTGAGPDRGTPRDRAGSRSSSDPGDGAEERPRSAGPSAALRLVLLGTVVGVLVISAAASLQIYFRQQRQLAELRTAITQRQQAIDDLNRQLASWNDPAYVRQQARQRLGWVMPGETGYRVIGADGKPLEGARLDSQRSDQATPATDAWWMKMWGSATTADRPTPASDVPVGASTPAASATPSATPSSTAGGRSTGKATTPAGSRTLTSVPETGPTP
ncbi:FtsB family cell division protein [Raineyella sp. W15-4]|uniref:FtsB family cell division protein n=1 Tax=Raineyella sp. W15-4 TaxID=3081651 RepID=UPI002953CF30|nr:septum formation initiator family protein [Raineyella sp. W15-4]WOQ16094.1 septum formation initiator family protein [Raineyella sp. W15-4]